MAYSLPEGYSKTEEERAGINITRIHNKDKKLVLSLPTEYCTPQRIEEVIKQIERALAMGPKTT